jgi:hypothetical protein
MDGTIQYETEFDANEIVDRLWLGSERAAHCTLEILQEHNISHILTVALGIPQIHGSDACFLIHRPSNSLLLENKVSQSEGCRF